MNSLLALGARAVTMVISLVCGVITTRMILGETDVDHYALYTLLIPDQTFAGGVVHIVAIEGSIEKVRVDIAGRPSSRVEAYAAKLEGERPLTRTRLERQISLMRDLPGFLQRGGAAHGEHAGSAQCVDECLLRQTEMKADHGRALLQQHGLQCGIA